MIIVVQVLEVVYGIFAKIRGAQYRPQYTIVLAIRTPKRGPLILGNPQMNIECWAPRRVWVGAPGSGV